MLPPELNHPRWAFIRRAILIGLISFLIIAAIAVAFGVSSADLGRFDAFAVAVGRWQVNPDFRLVQREYVEVGTRAMQARWWGQPIGRVIMAFRSIPGIGQTLAANPNSASHYEDFTRGPLSAYLHLIDEQGLSTGLGMIRKLAQNRPIRDQDIRQMLRSFNMPTSVATDAGAVASVR